MSFPLQPETTDALSIGTMPGPLLPAVPSDSGQPAIGPPVFPEESLEVINERRRLLRKAARRPDGTVPAPIKRRKVGSPKPPKDTRVRKVVVAVSALRAQGLTYKEAAEHLHLSYNTVKSYLHRARTQGWFSTELISDPTDKVEHVLTELAVNNIGSILKETREQSESLQALSDRAVDTSLEVAKGVGLLKSHSAIKQDTTNVMGMALKVEVVMPSGPNVPTAREGSIGGTPFFDAEVLEEKVDDTHGS